MAYASGEQSETPVRIFEYQPDRSGKRPESFLKGFTGYLVTDGYSGYNSGENVIHCGCWVHARRKWRDAMPDGATAKTAIRPFVIGRKNWLFCDTVKGAESSAIVYSLVETSKANGIDTYNYLFYTLSLLPYFGKSPVHEKLEPPMPWSPEVQKRYNEKLQPETE